MKKEELYYKTVDLLLDAYNERRLKHGHCDACAVGNICGSSLWAARFITLDNQDQVINPSEFRGANEDFDKVKVLPFEEWYDPSKETILALQEQADEVIAASGYSQKELIKIEFAFESSLKDIKWEDTSEVDHQFIGLCAVLDVLKEIHEVGSIEHESSSVRLKNVYKALSV